MDIYSPSSSPDVQVEVEWQEDARTEAPSHRLLVAIVRRAIWDFVLYRDEDPDRYKVKAERKKCEARLAIAEDAAGWLFWDGEEQVDGEGRYTFRYICEILDLSHAQVREHALKLTREDIQRLNNHIKEE